MTMRFLVSRGLFLAPLALAVLAACGSDGQPGAAPSDGADASVAELDASAGRDALPGATDAGADADANANAKDGAATTDASDASIAPGVPERVSPTKGYTHAITLTPSGAPAIAYGELSGVAATPYALAIAARGAAGWTHEPVTTTLAGSVSAVDLAYGPGGHRYVGYVQYVSSSGVGYGFRIWAANDASGAFTTKLLGDHSVNHNTAVGPDVDVASNGDVHVVIPLTGAVADATSLRHLASVGASVVDETIAPRPSGSSTGTVIGRIAAAVNAEAPLSLFTVADDSFGPDNVAYYTAPSAGSAVAVPIASFPDLGSSLTEIWGAALHKGASGYVAVTASSKGNGPVDYEVVRQGASAWTTQTVGPLGYGSLGWCSALLPDGRLALFVYAGIGMPVTSTGLRLLLVATNGTYTDRIVDSDVQSGIACSAVADATSVHLAYRKPDDGLYYQRVVP